ncbi:MAG: serine/threonine-protein kinase, partial [Lentisphaeria bacterium]
PHENICATVSLGFAGLPPYEIIEYVPGRNLRDLIHNRHESVKTNALEILRKVARGIRYMHDNKILHLDVKPENVLLNTGGDVKDGDRVVKLTDFDLSRRLSGGKSLVRSRAGTASHMAPEQLVKGSVSYGNDIFAFGVLAYYLVTGKMPFDGFTLKEVRRNQVSNNFEIAEPRKVNPDLAPRLSWVIMRCLERDTTERFLNLAYLCRELDRV